MLPAFELLLLSVPDGASEELGVLQLMMPTVKGSAISVTRSFVKCLIEILQRISLLFLGEVECNKTSPKGLFQVLWVVYTTQVF